jgi:predicted DNA-binding transcriptional regulator AlpA
MLGIAVVTLWRWAANGKLPKPIKLSERVTAWQVEDIRQWMASKGEQAS